MTVRVVIVDDEPLSRAGIRWRLRDHPDFEVLAEANSGREAIAAISRLRPDLVFLDVQMPDLDGLRVAELVRGPGAPVIVFVTAFERHAVAAFELEAADYLVKPIDDERFAATIARVRRRLTGRATEMASTDPSSVDGGAGTMTVRDGAALVRIQVEEIESVTAFGDLVRLQVGERRFVLRETMKEMVVRLGGGPFVRIHRSTIVNPDMVREIVGRPTGEFVLKLRSGSEVTSSRRYRAVVRSLMA